MAPFGEPKFHLGSVIKYDFGPRQPGDHRIEGLHYAVVVQTEQLSVSEDYSLIVVLYVTSTDKRGRLYLRVQPTPENGLDHASTVDCSQYYTLRKDDAGLEVVGLLSRADQYELKQRIKVFFGIS